MKIAIIGPGALGSLLAAFLGTLPDPDIWLLDHDPRRAASLGRHGLALTVGDHCRQVAITATAAPGDIVDADIALLCVKSYRVAAVLPALLPIAANNGLLVALQNGIGHLAPLARSFPAGCWALGVTALGATLTAPGQVRFGGAGPTRLGFLDSHTAQGERLLARLAAALNRAGLEAEVVADIRERIWAKLLVNIGINALTALHDCPNGTLAESPVLRARLAAAVEEAAAVARAKGIRIPADPVAEALAVCRATGANISSMLQDVRRQRRTEIEAINGAIVAEARQLGLPVPVNEELVQEIRLLEKAYLPVSP